MRVTILGESLIVGIFSEKATILLGSVYGGTNLVSILHTRSLIFRLGEAGEPCHFSKAIVYSTSLVSGEIALVH